MKLLDRNIWAKTKPKDRGKGLCPFCKCDTPENVSYVIWKGKYWLIMHNKFPILGSPQHIMLIPKHHRIFPHECSLEEMLEFPKAQKKIHDFFGGTQYFSFMRESLISRSLEHFHYHYIPGRLGYKDIQATLEKQGFIDQLADD